MRKFTTTLLFGASMVVALSTFGWFPNALAAPYSGVTGSASPATCPDAATREANKKVAEAFFRRGGTPQQMFNLMDPNYLQHNPEFKRFGQINHLHGRQEFTALISMAREGLGGFGRPPRTGPRPPQGNPLYKVMADCDMVVVLQQRYLPDPQHPGKFYEAFWFDAWRVSNGKLVEHWDAATIPTPVPEFLKVPLKDMKPAKRASGGN